MRKPRILSRPLLVVSATVAAALLAVYACEKPVGTAPSTTAVAVVAVTPPSGTVVVGATMQFAATPEDPNGNPLSGRAVTWGSSAPGVASVDGSGMVRGVAVGAATITATSEGKSGTASVTVASVPVAAVAVTPPAVTIPQGQTVQLTATPQDASGNALGGRVITWASGNRAVATVSGSGLVRAVAPGAATITATSEGQSGTASVTVTAPPPPGTCLTSSATWQNTAFATQTGAFTAEFDATPNSAAMDGTVGLAAGVAASNTDLAVILRFNPSGQIDARNGGAYAAASVMAYSAGTSYHFRLVVDLATHSYSAYVTPAGGAEATLASGFAFRTEQSAVTALAQWALQAGTGTHTVCNFSLGGTTPAPVATVSVSPATANVLIGATVQLTATPKDANGTPLSGRVVTWASNNQAVATVSASGLVTAQAVGTATITATSEGKSGTAAITVTDVAVASVDVAPATASVPVNGTVQLVATPKDGSGTPLAGRVVTWASSSTTIATVSASGLVTGKAAGTATITATSEGKSGTASITVTPVPVAAVTVSPASQTIQTGGAVQLTATPRDASGTPLSGRTITWASDHTGVATVSATGLVTGAGVGTATITATSEGKSGTAAITVTTVSGAAFGHVFIVAEENHNYADVVGSASMPYLNGLSTQYGLATNYFANSHPSIGNYFEVSTGDTIINNDSFTGTVTNDNIIRELVKAGRTWKAYVEGYPSYDANHVPMSYFSDIRNDATQAARMVPFTQLASDLANGTLPQFSFITPNTCNDAHSCSLSTADTWLKTKIDPLIQSAAFQKDGLLIIWWDESASDHTNGGGKVAWTVVSPFAKRGYQSTAFYRHQSTLRLMLRALGVFVYPGDAATAPDMDEFFTIPLPAAPAAVGHR